MLQLKEVEVVVLEDRIDFKYKKPSRELSGKFTIVVKNAQGEDSRDVTINFQGKLNFVNLEYRQNKLFRGVNHKYNLIKMSPTHLPVWKLAIFSRALVLSHGSHPPTMVEHQLSTT